MAHYCKSCSFFNKKLVSLTLSTTSDVHVTRPVSELLFDGYTDSLVSAVGMLPIDLGAELDRFGFFYDVGLAPHPPPPTPSDLNPSSPEERDAPGGRLVRDGGGERGG